MLLGTVAGRKATCALCGWDAPFADPLIARKALAEHLKDDHRRVLINVEEGTDRSGQPWAKFQGPKYAEKEWDKA